MNHRVGVKNLVTVIIWHLFPFHPLHWTGLTALCFSLSAKSGTWFFILWFKMASNMAAKRWFFSDSSCKRCKPFSISYWETISGTYFVVYASCLPRCLLACSLQPCGHLPGKGYSLDSLVCDVFLCVCHFPMWCPWSGVHGTILYRFLIFAFFLIPFRTSISVDFWW